ncbi:MAG: hypothetical protein ACOYIA_05045 [Eubacteriales bacterium]
MATETGFFAASNSGRGFKNYYEQIFGRADRIFVVKGGPGTGKSRFMNDVAGHAEEAGWAAEYYYCSSDPASLDGVLLYNEGRCVAVIDGTPPHPWEPALPGVREEIVNLGEFWDSAKLSEAGEEIRELTEKRAELWRMVYRWLAGCLDMCEVIKSIGAACLDPGVLREGAEAMLAGVPDGEKPGIRPALLSSVGMAGSVSSEHFIRNAATLFVIKDRYMTAHVLLGEVIRLAQAKKLSVIVSYDPIDADRADGLFIEGSRVAAVVGEPGLGRESINISMDEFITLPDKKTRARAEYAERCRAAMLAGAVDVLGEIRTCHFRLEEIYTLAMNFEAKEAFTREFCQKYFPK